MFMVFKIISEKVGIYAPWLLSRSGCFPGRLRVHTHILNEIWVFTHIIHISYYDIKYIIYDMKLRYVCKPTTTTHQHKHNKEEEIFFHFHESQTVNYVHLAWPWPWAG